MNFVIVDIDGVLADATHRLPLIKQKVKDWDGFFSLIGKDTPIHSGRELLKALHARNAIVLCTGRPARLRDETMAWLNTHDMPYSYLVMRANDDRRPDYIIKPELIRDLPRKPIMAFDDSPRVVETWRALGIPCYAADNSTWMA